MGSPPGWVVRLAAAATWMAAGCTATESFGCDGDHLLITADDCPVQGGRLFEGALANGVELSFNCPTSDQVVNRNVLLASTNCDFDAAWLSSQVGGGASFACTRDDDDDGDAPGWVSLGNCVRYIDDFNSFLTDPSWGSTADPTAAPATTTPTSSDPTAGPTTTAPSVAPSVPPTGSITSDGSTSVSTPVGHSSFAFSTSTTAMYVAVLSTSGDAKNIISFTCGSSTMSSTNFVTAGAPTGWFYVYGVGGNGQQGWVSMGFTGLSAGGSTCTLIINQNYRGGSATIVTATAFTCDATDVSFCASRLRQPCGSQSTVANTCGVCLHDPSSGVGATPGCPSAPVTRSPTLHPTSGPATSSPTVVPTVAPSPPPPLYIRRSIGNCLGDGLYYVESALECRAAAAFVGFWVREVATSYTGGGYPQGCWTLGERLVAFSEIGNQATSSTYLSICRTSATAPPTTAAPSTTAPTSAAPTTIALTTTKMPTRAPTTVAPTSTVPTRAPITGIPTSGPTPDQLDLSDPRFTAHLFRGCPARNELFEAAASFDNCAAGCAANTACISFEFFLSHPVHRLPFCHMSSTCAYALTRTSDPSEAAHFFEKITASPSAAPSCAVRASGPLILDVRQSQDFEAGSLGCAVSIPRSQVGVSIPQILSWVGGDRSYPIKTLCYRGNLAEAVWVQLTDQGFTNVVNAGGYNVSTRVGLRALCTASSVPACDASVTNSPSGPGGAIGGGGGGGNGNGGGNAEAAQCTMEHCFAEWMGCAAIPDCQPYHVGDCPELVTCGLANGCGPVTAAPVADAPDTSASPTAPVLVTSSPSPTPTAPPMLPATGPPAAADARPLESSSPTAPDITVAAARTPSSAPTEGSSASGAAGGTGSSTESNTTDMIAIIGVGAVVVIGLMALMVKASCRKRAREKKVAERERNTARARAARGSAYMVKLGSGAAMSSPTVMNTTFSRSAARPLEVVSQRQQYNSDPLAVADAADGPAGQRRGERGPRAPYRGPTAIRPSGGASSKPAATYSALDGSHAVNTYATAQGFGGGDGDDYDLVVEMGGPVDSVAYEAPMGLNPHYGTSLRKTVAGTAPDYAEIDDYEGSAHYAEVDAFA